MNNNNKNNGITRLSKLNIPNHFKEGNFYKALHSTNSTNNNLQNNEYPNIPIYFKNEINSIEDL